MTRSASADSLDPQGLAITVERLAGPALTAAIDDLAALRIAVFAEWPYLYAGDRAYEVAYLQDFAASPDAALVVARAGAADGAWQIVGAATASPLALQSEGFRAPIARAVAGLGIDPARVFYFGESVLLPAWRGRGLGHAFFDAREAAARDWGAEAACFAAVVRPAEHPARPQAYRPLDPFWRARGYAPLDGCLTAMAWADHGETGESDKPMQVWLRAMPRQG